MNEKLEEPLENVKLNRSQKNDVMNQVNCGNSEVQALPLSAFQEELEEAANEPLFGWRQKDVDEKSLESDCSEFSGDDEVYSTKSELEETKVESEHEIINTSVSSSSNSLGNTSKHRFSNFATPTVNNPENCFKYTPSLTRIQEYSAKKGITGNGIFQTPNNNVLANKHKTPLMSNLTNSLNKRESYIEMLANRRSNGKAIRTDVINCVQQTTLADRNMHINETNCVKELSFNSLTTSSINKNYNSLETPKAEFKTNSLRSDSIQNSLQKKKNLLENEKKYLLSKEERTNTYKDTDENNTQEKRKFHSSILTNLNKTEKGQNMKPESENKEKLKQFKSIDEESCKENISHNKCNEMGAMDRDLQLFDKIVVNNVEYIVLHQLGRGGSSIVYDCYDPINKLQRAIKKVSLKGDKACVEGYINEVKMLYKLRKCDRIVKLFSYEILKSERLLYMVLEKGDGDLSSALRDLSTNTSHLPTYKLIYFWMEMLFAVKEIHENGIIHSDLKPANFLFTHGGLKLIDFGIASNIQIDMTSVVKNVQIGSFNYISPEALRNNSSDSKIAEFKISYKSDVWSLGCILYQLVYRKTPFQHIGHMFAKLSAILDPNQKINYPNANWVPSKIIETIKTCLRYEMSSRPSIDELIKEYESFL